MLYPTCSLLAFGHFWGATAAPSLPGRSAESCLRPWGWTQGISLHPKLGACGGTTERTLPRAQQRPGEMCQAGGCLLFTEGQPAPPALPGDGGWGKGSLGNWGPWHGVGARRLLSPSAMRGINEYLWLVIANVNEVFALEQY